MTNHTIGTREQWLAARRALLEREKELTRRNDELARERQALPWVPIEKAYRFETEDGTRTLAELFDGRSQLLVYHFMFGADWDAGCVGCSFLVDHLDGALPHLHARDVTLTCVARAPLPKLEAYRRRMGWKVPWASSHGSDFNFDFGVSFTEANGAEYNFRPIDAAHEELPGLSAFVMHDGAVHHTYSSYARGGEALIGAYQLLDRAPMGRDEDGLPHPSAWWRRHDEYA